MKIPALRGLIDRRVLVNFTADPALVQPLLPPPFRPQVYGGKAVVGICLIRLKAIRPKGLPGFLGISSENGAHRIAVEWLENGQLRQGVYIPRRDTSSWLNSLAGGRLFPGQHFRAAFDVRESQGAYHIAFASTDGTTIAVDGHLATGWPAHSVFASLEAASDFFRRGEVGYSPGRGQLDGMHLKVSHWQVQPLHVTAVRSSFFEDASQFPAGAVQFDNALLMTRVPHEWLSLGQLTCGSGC